MDLEVAGIAERLCLVLANRGAHTRTGSDGETGSRAAHSARQSPHDLLLIHRRVDGIDVIEELPRFQRISGAGRIVDNGIILLDRLNRSFADRKSTRLNSSHL